MNLAGWEVLTRLLDPASSCFALFCLEGTFIEHLNGVSLSAQGKNKEQAPLLIEK